MTLINQKNIINCLSGKEQVVPTDSPTDSTTTKNLAQSPDYVKQFELFSGNDIFATREE